MRLYELTAQYKSLEALESSEDLPPELIRDTLEGLEGELREKAISVAHFCRNLESVADAIDEATATMQARGTRLRARAQSLQQYLLLNMQFAGITKIDSPYFTLTVKKNPPTVVIDSENLIPTQYMRTPAPAPPPKPTPDKEAIAKAIKAGSEVPGAHTETRERLEFKL